MPKKTKRQKMAVEMRKHKIIEKHVEVEKPVFQPTTQVQTTKQVKKSLFSTESTMYFKKDLKRSILITVLLLLIEVGIYISQQNGLSFNINLPF